MRPDNLKLFLDNYRSRNLIITYSEQLSIHDVLAQKSVHNVVALTIRSLEGRLVIWPSIAIFGAGIAGLSAAHELARRRLSVRGGHFVDAETSIRRNVAALMARRWRYEVDGFVIEKRLFLPYRQNTVHVTYQLLSGHGKLRLGLRPALHFRSHDALVNERRSTHYKLSALEDQFEITGAAGLPALRLIVHGPATAFTFDRKESTLIPYRTERNRGYEWQGSLWSPGYFRADLGYLTTITDRLSDFRLRGVNHGIRIH